MGQLFRPLPLNVTQAWSELVLSGIGPTAAFDFPLNSRNRKTKTIKRLWVSLAYFSQVVLRLSGRHGVLAYFVYYG